MIKNEFRANMSHVALLNYKYLLITFNCHLNHCLQFILTDYNGFNSVTKCNYTTVFWAATSERQLPASTISRNLRMWNTYFCRSVYCTQKTNHTDWENVAALHASFVFKHFINYVVKVTTLWWPEGDNWLNSFGWT